MKAACAVLKLLAASLSAGDQRGWVEGKGKGRVGDAALFHQDRQSNRLPVSPARLYVFAWVGG